MKIYFECNLLTTSKLTPAYFCKTHQKQEACWKPSAIGGGLGWCMLGPEPAPAAGRRQRVPDLPSLPGEEGGKCQANFKEGLHRDLGNTGIFNLALVYQAHLLKDGSKNGIRTCMNKQC